ncbi:hypothetical protein B5F27_13490 [Faecalibacterium sp. An192]|nr:hypothetical protein B5F27_13490 [Faecalibacterium sp. An192]
MLNLIILFVEGFDMRPIYICLAADDNYAQLASVAIASVIKSNMQAPIEFFILDSGISCKNKEILNKQVKDKGKEISFISVIDKLEKLKEIGVNSQGYYHSFAAYARFYVIDILPNYIDKLLYIDCDTCVCESLQKLFEINLRDNLLGAVIDILPNFHKKAIGFDDSDLYFNSGVLLFNVKKWKEDNMLKRIEEHMIRMRCKYSFHDQDIINIVCKGYILPIAPCYMVFLPEYSWGVKGILQLTNLSKEAYYTEIQIANAFNKPAIIHYVETVFGRPWYNSCKSRYFEKWFNAFRESPFSESFEYVERKISLRHRMLEMAYYLFPRRCFIALYKKRKDKVLLEREINAKKQ